MFKAIAAGSALLCATLAWFIMSFVISLASPTFMYLATFVTAIMFMSACALLIAAPFVGLYNWAKEK